MQAHCSPCCPGSWVIRSFGPSGSLVRSLGRVAELADAQDSGSCVRKDVGVQVPPRPPTERYSKPPSMSGNLGCNSSIKVLIVRSLAAALIVARTFDVSSGGSGFNFLSLQHSSSPLQTPRRSPTQTTISVRARHQPARARTHDRATGVFSNSAWEGLLARSWALGRRSTHRLLSTIAILRVDQLQPDVDLVQPILEDWFSHRPSG